MGYWPLAFYCWLFELVLMLIWSCKEDGWGCPWALKPCFCVDGMNALAYVIVWSIIGDGIDYLFDGTNSLA